MKNNTTYISVKDFKTAEKYALTHDIETWSYIAAQELLTQEVPLKNLIIIGEDNSGFPAKNEMVDHPFHYNNHPSGVECIDIIEHLPYNVCSVFKHMPYSVDAAFKYLWRKDDKHPTPLEDLEKAKWYLNREIKRVKKILSKKGEI